VAAAERRSRLAQTAELLGLAKLLARKPSELSGGQQQRVALGRAIIAKTPVCLMDEPLSNLDAQLRNDMRREIRSLQRSLGITMVYVTHDQTEAMSMADQVILLRSGLVEQDAAPADLYARPATVFAARFIGTPPMNIVALADGAQGAVIQGTQGQAIYPGRGEGLLLGVRPENMQLVASGIAARLEAIEYLGADSVLACRAGSELLIVRAPGKVTLAPGAAVQLAWPREAMHLFDAANGKRKDGVLAVTRAAA
jgi:sn-glycerol 3-phosphate transport system ATP-binding protein